MSNLFAVFSKCNQNSENKPLFYRVEGGDARQKLYWLTVVTEEQSTRMVMVLLGPRSQIRRYTPIYQCPNNGVRAEGIVAAVLLKFLMIKFKKPPNIHKIFKKM